MITVRIISNPYERQVTFETLDGFTNEYIPVDIKNNPGSKLISEEIKGSFFPFKIKEIINTIESEYIAFDEKVEIEFQGTDDEYQELEEACRDDEMIYIKRAELELENARDILPRIIGIFGKIQPIIEDNLTEDESRLEIEKSIKKFTESSNDIVPICVLGNYSSGKSSFINALIGQEILPSGDLPVTAKVYRIGDAAGNSGTEISFRYFDEVIRILIGSDSFEVKGNGDIAYSMKAILAKSDKEVLASKVEKCLSEINEHDGVSDLIDIKIPFADGQLKESKQSFVIFDTPGSNTATNKKHIEILRSAMQDLSNGVPIYIAEYDSLDSCDNENLYHTIKDINQIDDRFTMIVVNKADNARIRIEEEDEEDIKKQAVPKNLYSGGIFFVSSIMGLGAKTDGFFVDEYAEEIFDDQLNKFKDPSHKRYRTLYKYNIMPEQIKRNIISVSEQEENKLYANSGLFAVEHEIVNFAEKYSAYDKCTQSDRYLGNAIEKTKANLEQIKLEREKLKDELDSELAEYVRQLKHEVEERNSETADKLERQYIESMRLVKKENVFSYVPEQVRQMDKDIREGNKEEYHLEAKVDDVKDNIAGVLKGIGRKSLKDIGKDVKTTVEAVVDLNESRISSNKETSDELIDAMNKDLEERLEGVECRIEASSKNYWEGKTIQVKDELSRIVSESETLDEEKKKEINEIIMSYHDLEFNEVDQFKKNKFELTIKVLSFKIDLNRIDTARLTKEYNRVYANSLEERYKATAESHQESFEKWNRKLINQITGNIIGYSPRLTAKAKQIEEEEEKISALAETIHSLEMYREQIKALMEWK